MEELLSGLTRPTQSPSQTPQGGTTRGDPTANNPSDCLRRFGKGR